MLSFDSFVEVGSTQVSDALIFNLSVGAPMILENEPIYQVYETSERELLAM